MEVATRKENEQLQKTTIPSLLTTTRSWYFLDLKDKIVGRMAPKIVEILRGKNKNNFLPNLDLGDYVVLINAKYITFTGNGLPHSEISGYYLFPKPQSLSQDITSFIAY